uniref:Uncharacterized protein n=1 Tax=Thermorudis sp. TaxID=1969470 RepID=A0A7C3AR73_9BACT
MPSISRNAALLFFTGSLLVAARSLVEHGLGIQLDDFAGGLLTGVGIGLLVLSLRLQRGPAKASNR